MIRIRTPAIRDTMGAIVRWKLMDTSLQGPKRPESGLRAGLERIGGLTPGAQAAVECDGSQVPHGAQRSGRECRNAAELAVHDHAARGVRQVLVDAQLELATRQEHRPRDVCHLVS